jgi:hypothetical protein
MRPGIMAHTGNKRYAARVKKKQLVSTCWTPSVGRPVGKRTDPSRRLIVRLATQTAALVFSCRRTIAAM